MPCKQVLAAPGTACGDESYVLVTVLRRAVYKDLRMKIISMQTVRETNVRETEARGVEPAPKLEVCCARTTQSGEQRQVPEKSSVAYVLLQFWQIWRQMPRALTCFVMLCRIALQLTGTHVCHPRLSPTPRARGHCRCLRARARAYRPDLRLLLPIRTMVNQHFSIAVTRLCRRVAGRAVGHASWQRASRIRIVRQAQIAARAHHSRVWS